MDPTELFRSDRIFDFWPTAQQSARDRVHSTTRFILYACTVSYLISRDKRVFALGILVLAILYYLFTNGMIPEPNVGVGAENPYRAPTRDNSMANALMMDAPGQPPADWFPCMRQAVNAVWSEIHPFEKRRDAERNFHTVPENDQAIFAQASYGRPFSQMCKDQGGSACDPDKPNFHFPEVTQMRASR
jgi:hypothetical protein